MNKNSIYRPIAVFVMLCAVYFLSTGSYAQTPAPPAGDSLTLDDTSAVPGDETVGEKRTMLDTLQDGGLVGLLIGLLSMVAIGFIIEHFLTIRRSVLIPEEVAFDLEEMIEQGRIDEAIEACKEPMNRSLLAYVVQSGLERYRGSEFGFAEYKAAVEEAGEEQTGQLYRKMMVLELIGKIAPMMGLIGTVLGMIKAFNSMALASSQAVKGDELAGSIGQAMVTTLLGLVVAIPAMVAYSFFVNRIDSLVAEAGKRVEQIMMPLGRRR